MSDEPKDLAAALTPPAEEGTAGPPAPADPKPKAKAKAEAKVGAGGEPKVTEPVVRPPEQKPMKAAMRKAIAEAVTIKDLQAAVGKLKPEERDAQAIYEATERLMAPTLAKGR